MASQSLPLMVRIFKNSQDDRSMLLSVKAKTCRSNVLLHCLALPRHRTLPKFLSVTNHYDSECVDEHRFIDTGKAFFLDRT